MILFILVTPLFCLPALLPVLFADPDNRRLERGPLGVACLLTCICTSLCISFAVLGGGLFWLLLGVAMAAIARLRGSVDRHFRLINPRWTLFWSQAWGNIAFVVFLTLSGLLGPYGTGHMVGYAFFAVLGLGWLLAAPHWGALPSLSRKTLEQRARAYGREALTDRSLTQRDRQRLTQILERQRGL